MYVGRNNETQLLILLINSKLKNNIYKNYKTVFIPKNTPHCYQYTSMSIFVWMTVHKPTYSS